MPMLGFMAQHGVLGRPQAAKLGLKAGLRVVLHDVPEGWALTDPPDGLDGPGPDGEADVIVAFFSEAGEIGRQIGGLAPADLPGGGALDRLAAAGGRAPQRYHRQRHPRDVLPIGLVDVKVAAIDEDWSGLRVVWRTENRGGVPWPHGFHLTLKA